MLMLIDSMLTAISVTTVARYYNLDYTTFSEVVFARGIIESGEPSSL